MEKHGNYLYGTQDEIDNYRIQQTATNIAIGATAAIVVVPAAAIVGVAHSYNKMKEQNNDCNEQIERWHNIYYRLWGKEKADSILNKVQKGHNVRHTLAFVIPFLVLSITGLLFHFSVLDVSKVLNLFGLSHLLSNVDIDEVDGIVKSAGLMWGIAMFITTLITIPIANGSSDISLLRKYNVALYKAYPIIKCPHCGKKAFVLSLGQCRKCFKFIHRLSNEDAQALSKYKMVKQYNIMYQQKSEFFSAEIGRTLSQKRKLLSALFSLPFIIGSVPGALYILFSLKKVYESTGSIGWGFLMIFSGLLAVVFPMIAIAITIGIFNMAISRDARKFIASVRSEISKHNLPTNNWE